MPATKGLHKKRKYWSANSQRNGQELLMEIACKNLMVCSYHHVEKICAIFNEYRNVMLSYSAIDESRPDRETQGLVPWSRLPGDSTKTCEPGSI